MRRTRRKTTVPWCSRAASNAYFNLFDDRLFGPTHTNVETHTYAGIIRRFSLYGSRFVERTSIFRQNFNYVDAG